MTTRVRIGMLRLTDSAPVVVAKARDLFRSLDLHPVLSIEPSWANLADKLAYGLLDAAVMLPPLVLASAMGLRGPAVPLIVPMGLSQGGNTIVLGGEATPDAELMALSTVTGGIVAEAHAYLARSDQRAGLESHPQRSTEKPVTDQGSVLNLRHIRPACVFAGAAPAPPATAG